MALTREQLRAIHAGKQKELDQVRKISLTRGIDHAEARKLLQEEELSQARLDFNKEKLDFVRKVSKERGIDHAQARKLITSEGLAIARAEAVKKSFRAERKQRATLNQKKAIFALTMKKTNNIDAAKKAANTPKTSDEASTILQGLGIGRN